MAGAPTRIRVAGLGIRSRRQLRGCQARWPCGVLMAEADARIGKVRHAIGKVRRHNPMLTLHIGKLTSHFAKSTPHIGKCTLHIAKCTRHFDNRTLHIAKRTLHIGNRTLHFANVRQQIANSSTSDRPSVVSVAELRRASPLAPPSAPGCALPTLDRAPPWRACRRLHGNVCLRLTGAPTSYGIFIYR